MSQMPQRPPNLPPSGYGERDENPAQRAAWGIAGAGGCLVVLLVIVLIGAVLTAGTVGGGLLLVRGALGSIFSGGEPPRAGVTSSQTIVTQVRPLGQLVSIRADYAKADIEVSIQQGQFQACNHTANHVAAARIEAGIDLYEIGEESVTYDAATDTYTLTVPQPIITSCSMEFIDQYTRRLNIPTCSVDWDDARQIAQYTALIDLRQEAVEGGLLEQARRQTDFALTSFVQALTGSNVVVQFEAGTPTDEEIFANCNPQPPRDWQQDTATGEWVKLR